MVKDMNPKPTFGLTMGMADILASKTILLLVSGKHKQAVLKTLMPPDVTTQFPASSRWSHSRVKVICDKVAAEKLQ